MIRGVVGLLARVGMYFSLFSMVMLVSPRRCFDAMQEPTLVLTDRIGCLAEEGLGKLTRLERGGRDA